MFIDNYQKLFVNKIIKLLNLIVFELNFMKFKVENFVGVNVMFENFIILFCC